MILLLILFDLPLQLFLLSPVILWFSVSTAWRPLIAALGLVIWGGLAVIVWRRYQRVVAEDRAGALPQGDWRWPAQLGPEAYAQRIGLLLHNHGWRAMQTLSTEPQAVTLLMQKDRAHVLLRCRRDSLAPAEQEFAALATLRDAHNARTACLMLAAPCPARLVAAASEHGVHLLRLADIPFLDSPTGPLAIDFG
jgi:hypothetical protein